MTNFEIKSPKGLPVTPEVEAFGKLLVDGSKEELKPLIRLRPVCREKFEEAKAKGKVTVEKAGLPFDVVIAQKGGPDGFLSCGIDPGFAKERLGMSEDQLIHTAKQNIDVEAKPMFQFLAELNPGLSGMLGDVKDDPLTVITDKYRWFGPSAIFDEDLMENLSNKVNDSLVIIPSSVYELIVMPKSLCEDLSLVNELIHEVNDTQIKENERLGECCILYDKYTKEYTVMDGAEKELML